MGARKAIVSKQQAAEVKLRTTNWARKSAQRDQQMTELEKLQHEIHLLGETIKSNAAALKSKTMSGEDRDALQRQTTVQLVWVASVPSVPANAIPLGAGRHR